MKQIMKKRSGLALAGIIAGMLALVMVAASALPAIMGGGKPHAADLLPVSGGNTASIGPVDLVWQSGSIDFNTMNGDIRGVAIPAMGITATRVTLETAMENGLLVVKNFIMEDFAFAPEPGKGIKIKIKIDGIEMREFPVSAVFDDDAYALRAGAEYASRLSVKGAVIEIHDIFTSLDSLSFETIPPARKGGLADGTVRMENLTLHRFPFDDPFLQYLLRNRKPVINIALTLDVDEETPPGFFGGGVVRIEVDVEERGGFEAEFTQNVSPEFAEVFAAATAFDAPEDMLHRLDHHVFLEDARFTLRDDGFLDEVFDFLASAEGGGLSREQAIELFMRPGGADGLRQAPETYAILEQPLRGFLGQGGSLEITLNPTATRSHAEIREMVLRNPDAGMKSLGFAVKHIK